MSVFKIKLEDKAAFLNRMEKAGVGLDSNQIIDNKLKGYFEATIDEPKQLEVAKSILKQSPKINTIKEMENNTNYNSNDIKIDTDEINGSYLFTIHWDIQKINYLLRLIYM